MSGVQHVNQKKQAWGRVLRAAPLVVGVVFTLEVLYPLALWLVLDVGLQLHLGLVRVYVLWMGFEMLCSTVWWVVYLLGEDTEPSTTKKPGKPRQIWRQF